MEGNQQGIDPIGDVLIVDDDSEVRETLKIYCENSGLFRNVVTAADGQIAASMLNNQKFELILLDINMPRRNGTQVLEGFLGNDKNVNKLKNVVVVSGELGQALIKEVLSMGVRQFLVKPFNEEDFKDKINAVIN